MSKKIGSLVLLLIVLGIAILGYRYISFRQKYAVSDAAFIKSDRLSTLSFKIGGKVIELNDEENQAVKKGTLLAKMDPTDLILQKKKVEHQLSAMGEGIEALVLKKKRLKESLKLQSKIRKIDLEGVQDRIEAMHFRILASQIRLEKLVWDERRYQSMLARKLISDEDFKSVQTKRAVLSKQIEAMKRDLAALLSQKSKAKKALELAKLNEREIAELDKEIMRIQQEKKALQAGLEALERKISYTQIYAPYDGVIAKKFFKAAPRVVSKGAPVYALVDPQALYCEVLLSEKKLRGVLPGNPVQIEVKAIKGKKYHGRVESIAPTSASTFSLVPRDIASGEFTKLDQRFIVRIKLKEKKGLRAGMGASVAIKRVVHD